MSKNKCLKCNGEDFLKYSTLWQCKACQHFFPCFNGMPKLYLENDIGIKDRSLRDYFYNGFLGQFYQTAMPFLTLPARPFKSSKKDWLFYFIALFTIGILFFKSINIFLGNAHFTEGLDIILNTICIFFFFFINYLFIKHPYFFYLFLLAIPVKISLSINKYCAEKGFKQVHNEIISSFISGDTKTLKILDISTGTGNSLYRHGWMDLNAEYTGLDLSETMLAQCQAFFSIKQVPIELIIGDATSLPFTNQYFDIVLNYGAINGYSDIKKALSEMTRVTQKGGLILFLDEELYSKSSVVEKFYFKKVLSSHNQIHHCPVEYLPPNVTDIKVQQVYEFYYICTCKVI